MGYSLQKPGKNSIEVIFIVQLIWTGTAEGIFCFLADRHNKPLYIDLSGPQAPNYCYLLMSQSLFDVCVPNV